MGHGTWNHVVFMNRWSARARACVIVGVQDMFWCPISLRMKGLEDFIGFSQVCYELHILVKQKIWFEHCVSEHKNAIKCVALDSVDSFSFLSLSLRHCTLSFACSTHFWWRQWQPCYVQHVQELENSMSVPTFWVQTRYCWEKFIKYCWMLSTANLVLRILCKCMSCLNKPPLLLPTAFWDVVHRLAILFFKRSVLYQAWFLQLGIGAVTLYIRAVCLFACKHYLLDSIFITAKQQSWVRNTD